MHPRRFLPRLLLREGDREGKEGENEGGMIKLTKKSIISNSVAAVVKKTPASGCLDPLRLISLHFPTIIALEKILEFLPPSFPAFLPPPFLQVIQLRQS